MLAEFGSNPVKKSLRLAKDEGIAESLLVSEFLVQHRPRRAGQLGNLADPNLLPALGHNELVRDLQDPIPEVLTIRIAKIGSIHG
ncbi:MAG: hypothetical protein NVS3B21_09960 [Acidimicrobiales bacterium]